MIKYTDTDTTPPKEKQTAVYIETIVGVSLSTHLRSLDRRCTLTDLNILVIYLDILLSIISLFYYY